MNVRSIFLASALTMTMISTGTAMAARDSISIVGSSTVYPFATVVAEQFGKASNFKTPKIESTGTGGGFKLFCGGVGVNFPDISNASRAIKDSEKETCAKNGVTDIIELKIGYDGIAVANTKTAPQMKLTRKEIFLALAKDVPDPANDGKLIPNPYKTWKEINPELPDTAIEVLGPPPTSGTRDAFTEMVLVAGAEEFDFIKKMAKEDKDGFKKLSETVREDGAYIEAGENDNLIVQKLQANPKALGIFGFSFLDQNADAVQGSLIEGEAPTFENISAGKYAVSRPLFIYIKKAHIGVIPGIKEFITEFSSEKAWGDEGYLADKGMIPMPAEERKKYADDVANLKTM
ncbi:MAG: PstS family phosphate ABC transporter substrate-binding protein [Desulfobulbaceae bacterium]|nr:MAG: PstS family phosphate ABC transporter substrate-binding protein [Desulfobulbaceae bacterium]